MRTKSVRTKGGRGGQEQRQQQQPLPEVRASKVLVKSKDAGRSRPARRTWVLPVLRVLALAASMLCLTPTGGMVTGMSKMDTWDGGSESGPQQEDRWSHGELRQEYVVFVGVPEENAVLPLKALAQEMMARGYRASLALPHGFQAWVEDIPGLSFLSLKPATTTTATSNATETCTQGVQQRQQQQTWSSTSPPSSSFAYPCPARPYGHGRKTPCKGKGLGDAWGGGVGGGWGAGLGIWRGLKGSLVGAREFLGHLRAYLRSYHREEAVMYAPLLEALRRDPPALVVADRRASAAFRACSKLRLRCVVNSAGLLGDLDRPPSSIPAPYTGFPMEGQTIAQRVHSSLIRLVLALSRMQAARDAEKLEDLEEVWEDETMVFSENGGSHEHYREHQHQHQHQHRHGAFRSSPAMALGNSCFGSLEYPRELPARVHMVGPLWVSHPDSDDSDGDGDGEGRDASGVVLSHRRGGNRSARSSPTSPGISSSSSSSKARRVATDGGDGGSADSAAAAAEVAAGADGEKEMKGGQKVLQDVWSWLEPENVEEDEAAPVVVVQLGYGGGWAWGVSPEAGVGGTGDGSNGGRLSWKAFREETMSQLSSAGCRTLWVENGPHPDDDDGQYHTAEVVESSATVSTSAGGEADEISGGRFAATGRSGQSSTGTSSAVSPTETTARHRKATTNVPSPSQVVPNDAATEREKRDVSPDDGDGGGDARGRKTDAEEEEEEGGVASLDGRRAVMLLDVKEEGYIGAAGVTGSSDWLLRVMSHRLVTILVTDGDVRSLQTALWHGKPSVVLPTSPDEREAAARLAHRGAGVTCPPPCNATSLTAAIIDAHGMDRRRGALRASAALRETGGVSRAGDLLENELRTHMAATAARVGCPYGEHSLWEDAPAWCYGEDRREERFSTFSEQFPDDEEPISVPEGLSWFPEGLSWFPDDPDWVWTEMSWLQRHLVDVYAVYGALVMGVGLLMKLTWNLVWSLCDITTAPPIPRGNLGSMDHLRSPSPSPAKDKCAAAVAAGGNNGGKLARGGTGKWGSGTGGWGGGGGGKHGRGGGGGKHSHGGGGGGGGGNVNISSAAIVHGEGTPPLSGGKYSKRMMAITNGNGHS